MMKRSYKNKTKQKSNESMEIEIKRQERQKMCFKTWYYTNPECIPAFLKYMYHSVEIAQLIFSYFPGPVA